MLIYMLEQEEIYKLKYLKYKKKYLDLKSSGGATGFVAVSVAKRQQDEARRRKKREEKEAIEKARKQKEAEEKAQFEALPPEVQAEIVKEKERKRIEQEEKRKAEEAERKKAEETKYNNDMTQAEPLIKQINELHKSSIDAQCGFSGCRAINSNIKKINDLIAEVRVINGLIANNIQDKLNESTDKQKKCNCISFF